MKKIDKNKYLTKLRYRKWLRSYVKYFYIGIPCLICLVLGIYFTYSKFFTSSEEEVVRTTVDEFIYGDVVLSYTLDGENGTSTFPKQNTGVEGTSVTCDNEATATWDNSLWSIKMTNMGNGSRVKCKVAFKTQETKTISGITFNLNTFSPDFSKSACSDCEYKEAGVFAAEDDYGTSYYYRGSVENNYVSFAGMTWRIIRINGDGSVRVILNDVITSKIMFNSSNDDNAYIGYMYGASVSSSYDETHKNTNDSTIKKKIDTWYEENLKNNYSNYLADSGFCGNRKTLSSSNAVGFGKIATYYNGYGKVLNNKPDLKCSSQNDLYTLNSSSSGNKALKYSIATITSDELLLAGSGGGVFDGSWNYTENSNNYLNIGAIYWTMTPAGIYIPYDSSSDVNRCHILVSTAGGKIDDVAVTDPIALRPVINLKSDAIKYGTGTSSNPYRVIEN